MLILKIYFKVIEIPEEDAIRQVYPKIYVYKIVKYMKYTVTAFFKLFFLICISQKSDKKKFRSNNRNPDVKEPYSVLSFNIINLRNSFFNLG